MRTHTLVRRPVRSVRSLLQFSAATGIVLPENVAEASETQLKTVVGEAEAALQALAALPAPTEEQVVEAQRLFAVLTDGKAELSRRGEEAASRRGAISDLLAPAATEEAVVEAETAAVETEGTEPEGDAVVAGGAPRASAVRRNGGGVTPRTGRSANLKFRTAADVPNYAPGQELASFDEAAAAILERTSGYPQAGAVNGVTQLRNGGLRLSRDFDPALVASAYDATEQIEHAASLARVGGADALLASGGWAAASETLYELVELEASDGMLDVPEIQIVRGGLRYTKGPLFESFRNQGFKQSETQAIAGTAKSFYHVPSIDFVEVRAGVVGLGVTSGILQNKAYPESVARILRGLLVAHTHEVNGDTIKDIVAGSTAVGALTGPASGAFGALLSAMELQAVDTRYRHSMDDNELLESFLPQWAVPVLRQDLSYRFGWNLERIPDSAITDHFADRKIRVQFTKDWQDITDTAGGLGSTTPAVAWPATVKFAMYPAGTWVRGLGDVISIDTLYDSVGLGTNDFTALFSEESYLTVMRGQESRVCTVSITADGSLPGTVKNSV